MHYWHTHYMADSVKLIKDEVTEIIANQDLPTAIDTLLE